MPKLFALLAGINTYHPASTIKVPDLTGCFNDIKTMREFLEDRFPKNQRHIESLKGPDATYRNVVDHFGKKLLLQAKKDDVVVFAYSGHGSYERAAPEFQKIEPNGKSETLVMYDSRTNGGFDLADKELAILINRVASTGAHVVILLDCCHSGSGTRGEDFILGQARQASGRSEPRPLDTYLYGAYLKQPELYVPKSRHILLAACDRTEKAFEVASQRGLFSASLMRVLEKSNASISYADLFTQCRLMMERSTNTQHPQFEPYEYFNSYEGFLRLSPSGTGATSYLSFKKGAWEVSMGANQGLPINSGNPSTFEILKDGRVLGEVRSRLIGLENTTLETPAVPLDTRESGYTARLTSLGTPKTIYQIKGKPDLVKQAKTALEKEFKSIYFDLDENASQAAYRMEMEPDTIRLFRASDGLCLRTIRGDDWQKMLTDVFGKMEHIARWDRTVALDNPNTGINRKGVELVLVELDRQGNVVRETMLRDVPEKEVVVEIVRTENGEQVVPIRIEVRNKSNKEKHCSFFYGGEDYSFQSVEFNTILPPGKSAYAIDKNSQGEQEKLVLYPANESLDILKLFISNSNITGVGFEQHGFILGDEVDYFRTKGGNRGGDELGDERGIGSFARTTQEDPNDWYALTLRLKCVARQATAGSGTIALMDGFIKIHPHASFRSGVAISAASTGSRSTEPMALIAELARHYEVELLSFGPTARDLAPVNMLELTDLQNEDSLKDEPLTIEVAAHLQESGQSEEFLLPLTFDGESIIPVGEVERLHNGHALVRITNIPDVADNRRSIGKALKLCFLKLVFRKENLQKLCWVDYSGEKIDRRDDNLRNKIATANNILLVTHGIIGDTKGMAECMRQAHDEKVFDLVLTFDYENLNTKIEATASILAQKLKDAGITADSGKKVTILAHSLGGLVSRYFIENLQGNKVVKHLIMAGTPNGGSAIAKLTAHRDQLMLLVGFVINSPWSIPAAVTLLAILRGSKIVTPTLEQMDYDHADRFLKNLELAPDPNIPYSIVAGDLQQYLDNNEEKLRLKQKMYRMGGKLFYENIPNDLAVSIESIKSVPIQRNPVAESMVVPTTHLNYFDTQESVQVIMDILKR